MRVLRSILSRFYFYILWAFLAVLVCGLLFSRLDDAPSGKKVTLFADVPAVEDRALAWQLEQAAPPPIRKVKVHPFSYAMFDTANLLGADLYIIPESKVESYSGSFCSLEGAGFETRDGYVRDGELWGVKVWDAGSRSGAATDYIRYPDEDCYLFINPASGHIASLSGTGDDAALVLARALLAIR
ncbi:MAG: hypothetical protein IIZ83_04650 [Oscillospiraceae bacterium]|nr:hypothetical protein [Oscillospiraceae bacterium]